MKKSTIPRSMKAISKGIANGTILFTYPIQRSGEQWNNYQKSLLIHSLAADFPIPPLYSLMAEYDGKKHYLVIDGKQRSTNVADFLDGKYPLHEATPPVDVDGEIFEIAGKLFSELEEDVQDAIKDANVTLYILDATDSEIEELFYRLNNGTPLSTQQKAKAKMGVKTATIVQEVMKCEFMSSGNYANFTKHQLLKQDNETVLMQSMMLIEGFDFKSFSTNHVSDYTAMVGSRLELLDYMKQVMDFFVAHCVEQPNSKLLKKLHIPFILYMTHQYLTQFQKADTETAKEEVILEFVKEVTKFEEEILSKDNKADSENPMPYKLGMGAGSAQLINVNIKKEAVEAIAGSAYKFEFEHNELVRDKDETTDMTYLIQERQEQIASESLGELE